MGTTKAPSQGAIARNKVKHIVKSKKKGVRKNVVNKTNGGFGSDMKQGVSRDK